MKTNPNQIERETDPVSSDEGVAMPAESSGNREDCTEAVDYVNQLIARMNGAEDPPTESSSSAPMMTEPIQRPETEENSATKPLSTAPLSAESGSTDPLSTASDTIEQRNEEPIEATPVFQSNDAIRQPQRPVVMAADMQRLREAANISVSGVLNSFETKSLYRAIYLYFFLAAGMIVSSILLIGMSQSVNSTAYYTSVTAALAAILASWKFLRLTNRLVHVLKHQDSHSLPDIPAL